MFFVSLLSRRELSDGATAVCGLGDTEWVVEGRSQQNEDCLSSALLPLPHEDSTFSKHGHILHSQLQGLSKPLC